MTALALFGRFVLAGEGPFLEIYERDHQSAPILVERCFDSHAIHGILVSEHEEDQILVLLWGGQQVRALLLEVPAVTQKLVTCSLAISNLSDVTDLVYLVMIAR